MARNLRNRQIKDLDFARKSLGKICNFRFFVWDGKEKENLFFKTKTAETESVSAYEQGCQTSLVNNMFVNKKDGEMMYGTDFN